MTTLEEELALHEKLLAETQAMIVPEEKRDRIRDLFVPSARTTQEVKDYRFSVCLECPRLTAVTHQCKECMCFMNKKTWLKDASCPLGKWESE